MKTIFFRNKELAKRNLIKSEKLTQHQWWMTIMYREENLTLHLIAQYHIPLDAQFITRISGVSPLMLCKSTLETLPILHTNNTPLNILLYYQPLFG